MSGAQAITVTPIEGDTLDELLFRNFGLGPEALAPALTANPGLAAKVTLTRHDVVTLPPAIIAPPPQPQRATVSLWE